MGYRDRDRFLAPEHRAKLFDRAGNAAPTVWVNGRAVGAWGQRKDDGKVIGVCFVSVETLDLGGLCRACARPKPPIWTVFEPENASH